MMNVNIDVSFNEKLAGAALIVGVSCLGLAHLISVLRGDDVKISKDGYSARIEKKEHVNCNSTNDEKMTVFLR